MVVNSKRLQRSGLDRAAAFIRDFCADTRGATAIEYCLMLVLISVACIGAFKAVGGAAGGGWGDVANKVGNAMK